MSNTEKYVPSAKAQAFLDTVESPKYERHNVNGLKPFLDERVPEDMRGFYSPEELEVLGNLKGTERDVEARMPVKMTRHYFDMAQQSLPLKRLVKASPDETRSLAGSEDPGFQMDYSPVEGLIHKYEMGLLYVTSTCSSHCRFCYREELIGRKQIERQDGTVAKKGLAKIKTSRTTFGRTTGSWRRTGGCTRSRAASACVRSSCPAVTPWCCQT